MEYSIKYRRQKRIDTGIIFGERVLFYEPRLLTKTIVTENAIKFVSCKSKQNLKSLAFSRESDNDSKIADYNDKN
jgi:hypothetical protein